MERIRADRTLMDVQKRAIREAVREHIAQACHELKVDDDREALEVVADECSDWARLIRVHGAM